MNPSLDSAEGTSDQVLRLRLEGQVLFSRALEMENFMFQGELNRLRERLRINNPPTGDQLVDPTPYPGGAHRTRPLADRIDRTERQPPSHTTTDDRGRAVAAREDRSLPPTVVIQPVDIHLRFLPLGTHFQEGGMGGPMFTRPQDWPDAIHENPSVRPRGVRRWGSRLVSLDDLHVYVQIGQLIYGGNRPPGRHDPADPQRPWKAIEAAFFRATVAIILQPGTFEDLYDQLTSDQRAPYRLPFLMEVKDPHQLDPADVVEHLTRSGIIKSWPQLEIVVGFAHSYLRDWSRHQSEITTKTELGCLFLSLYPNGIPRPNDRHFVEDAMRDDESWEDKPVDQPMEEDEEDEMPPLEDVTPSTSEGTRRSATPEEEKLDWGEEEL